MRTRFATATMDADRLLSFDRYALDLANERNAPQYQLEEARSALGVKTPRTSSPRIAMLHDAVVERGFEGGAHG